MANRREPAVNLLVSGLLALMVSQSPGVCTSPADSVATTVPPFYSSSEESLPTVAPVYNSTDVVTGCGHNLSLQAPPPLADGQVLGQPIVLVLNLSPTHIAETFNCSWLIHAPSNDSVGSLFTLRSSSPSFICFEGEDNDSQGMVVVKVPGTTYPWIVKGRSCYGNDLNFIIMVAGLKELFVQFFSSNITTTSVTIGSYRAFTVTRDYCGSASSPLQVDDVERSVVFPVTDPTEAFVIHRDCQWTLKTKPTFATIFVTVQMPAIQQGYNEYDQDQRYFIVVNSSHQQTEEPVPFGRRPVNFSRTIWGNEAVIRIVDRWSSDDLSVPVTPAINFTYKAVPISDICPSSPRPLNASSLADGLITVVNLDGGSSSKECLWRVTAPSSDMVVKLELGGLGCWKTNDTLALDDSSAINICEVKRCYLLGDAQDDSCFPDEYHGYPLWSEGQTALVRYRPAAGGKYSHYRLKYRAVRKAQGCQGQLDRRMAFSGHWQQFVWTTTSDDFYCRLLLSVSSTGMVVEAEITMYPGWDICGTAVQGYDGTTANDSASLPDRCHFRAGQSSYVSTSSHLLLVYDMDSSYGYYNQHVNNSKVVISYRAVSAAVSYSSTALPFAGLLLLLALAPLLSAVSLPDFP